MSDELTLHQKQVLFAGLVPKLIEWAFTNGYEVVFGEVLRTQAQANANAAAGIGITHSLHLLRLAVDLMLFKDGAYLTDSADYKPLGDYWKTLHPLCRWGGDFSKPDGDHFSVTHEGVQ